MNHLFKTNFREMDAFKGRHVTSKTCECKLYYFNFQLLYLFPNTVKTSGLKLQRESGWLED